MKAFIGDYLRVVTAAIEADYDDNYDPDRFGPAVEELGRSSVKAVAQSALRSVGLTTEGATRQAARSARQLVESSMALVEPSLNHLEWLYGRLGDEESRQLLVRLVAFRALGHRKIRLPTNTPAYWTGVEKAKSLADETDTIDLQFLGFKASRMDLTTFGYPISLYFIPFAAHIQFVMQPYRCVSGSTVIEADLGDVVLDCGGCYGDTALYFAAKVGPMGRVLSFEFVPANLAIWRRNIDLNPDLKPRIQLIESALAEQTGQPLFLEGEGPGTRVVSRSSQPGAVGVRTLALDDLVPEQGLERVDFIKMDIEGSELSVLRGSEETLKRFRPKLAISVYHQLEDFWSIPQYLESLDLGYRFHLRHFTIHAEETVLFAVPEPGQ